MRCKNLFLFALAGVLACVTVSCKVPVHDDSGKINKIMMVSDGTINDMSYNHFAWENLQRYGDEHPNVSVGYIEAPQAVDYNSCIDVATDSGADVIVTMGSNLATPMCDVACFEPNIRFISVDGKASKGDMRKNVSFVSFRMEEGAFVAGVLAALTSESGKVGFIGGQAIDTIVPFQFGFEAGVAYAGKVTGKKVYCYHQYIESFIDIAKGKAVADKMITTQGVDILFNGASAAGLGVVRAANEAQKYVIGTEGDQSFFAPDSVLFSVVRDMKKTLEIICGEIEQQGKNFEGKNFDFGLDEGVVDITYANEKVSKGFYDVAMQTKDKIINGEITVPKDLQSYEQYINDLNQLIT